MKRRMYVVLMGLIMGISSGLLAQGTSSAQSKPVQNAQESCMQQAKSSAKKSMMTPQEMAQKQTDKMTKNLALTTDQQKKVQAINLKYAQKRQEAMAKAKGGGEMTKDAMEQMKAGMKKSMADQEAEIKPILTAEQYQKYMQNKTELMDKMCKMKGGMKDNMKDSM